MDEVVEVWNELLARRSDPSLAPLTADEQAALLTNIFLVETESGGLSGALYNLSPTEQSSWSDLRQTARAVSAVCLHGVGKLLEGLADRLESDPSAGESSTWGVFLKRAETAQFSQTVATVEEHIAEMWEELGHFTTVTLINR